MERVLVERPDLRDEVFRAPRQGQNSVVVISANEVFKGARRPSQETPAFYSECKKLDILSAAGLPVPRVTYKGCLSFFFGMTRIHGACAATMHSRMPAGSHEKLAHDIADFILGFDDAMEKAAEKKRIRFSVGLSTLTFLPESELGEALGSSRVRHLLGDRHAFCVQEMNNHVKSTYEERPLFYAHTDMNDNNIILHPETGRLSGMVDVATIDRVPPVRTVRALRPYFGHAFAEAVLGNMAGRSGKYLQREHGQRTLALAVMKFHRQPTDAHAQKVQAAISDLQRVSPGQPAHNVYITR